MSAHDWQEMTDNCCNPRCHANRNAPSSKEPCPCSWDWPPQHSRTSNDRVADDRLPTLIEYARACSKAWISVEIVYALRELQQRRAGETRDDSAPLTRIAKIVRTNWGDDALHAISKVLDESLPGWLDKAPPVKASDNPYVVTEYQRGFDDGFRRATDGIRAQKTNGDSHG